MKLDAELGPDGAVTAAAGDEILRRDALALAGIEVGDFGDDALGILFERFEPAAMAQSHIGKVLGAAPEDGVEP